MRKRTQFLQVVVMALAVIGLGSHGYAQSNRGTVSGSIVDINGASIADAKIIATNTETGVVSETVSTGEGNYRLPELPPGTYTLSVTAANFKTAERTGVRVEINTAAALDIVLEAGAISDTVTIVADAPTVQSESSNVGTVVRPRQVLELPLRVNGVTGLRSPEAFAFLVPGVVGPGTATDNGANSDDPSTNNGGAFQSKITGSQNFANEVLLEGASVFRSENGSSFDETAPSVEALTEFKVQTSTLPAEFGRTGGGITSFVIRSGTNDVHGTVYDFIRQRVLNANRFFNNARGSDPLTGRERAPRPFDNFHNFGGAVGGPIFLPRFGEGGRALYDGRDRSFFFFAYEGFRRSEGGAQISTIPTIAFLRGDFSSQLTNNQIGMDALGRPIFAGQIFDPATQRTVNGQVVRDPFPGNIIPQSRFSSVARNVAAFFPNPSNAGRFNNFVFSAAFPTTVNAYTVKIDHALSDRNKLSGSFSQRINNRGAVATVRLPDPIDPEARTQEFTTRYYRIAHDFTISSKLLNYLSFGVNRTVSDNRSTVAGQNFASQIGLRNAGPNLFPRVGFGEGITNIGGEQFNLNIDSGFRINDNVSYVAGRHSFKFGGDFRYQQYTPTNQGGTSGRFFFGRGQTAAVVGGRAVDDTTGFGFASFLLGQVANGNINVSPNVNQWRSNYYALFGQDDFKVTKNLVLNLGLRWEVDTPRRELFDRTSSFDPTLPNPGAGGRPGALAFAGEGAGRGGTRTFAENYYKNFGPRLGFAYSPDRSEGVLGKLLGGAGKTVFRGGYGIYYQALVYADFGERLVAGFGGENNFTNINNNFDPAFNLDQGVPIGNLTLPRIDPTQRNGGDIEYVDRGDGRPPRIQNYSFEVQRELAPDLILAVGYVGANGDRLRSALRSANTFDPQFLRLGNTLFADINSPEAQAAGIRAPYAGFSGPVFQAIRPFPQYNNINSDCCLENEGTMNYNSLQVKLERRFRNGLNLLTSYTFSKTLTDADSALPIFATFSGGGSAQNPYDRRSERALSNQDIPHALVVSYIYELPIGAGKRFDTGNSVLNKLVGGFQIGAVHRYQSGQPLSFGCAAGIPTYGCIRYNQVPGQPLLSEAVRNGTFDPNAPTDRTLPKAQQRNIYINPLAFADPNANRQPNEPFRFGTMPRTIGDVRSPRFYNEDVSFIKKTPVTETVVLEFRTEVFNIFNRTILRRPNTSGATDPNPDSAFGRIFGQSNNPRAIQFGLKLLF